LFERRLKRTFLLDRAVDGSLIATAITAALAAFLICCQLP